MGGNQSVKLGVALDKASYGVGETVNGYVQVDVLADDVDIPELSVSLVGNAHTQVRHRVNDKRKNKRYKNMIFKQKRALLKLDAKVSTVALTEVAFRRVLSFNAPSRS
jgi:hypothetical protein